MLTRRSALLSGLSFAAAPALANQPAQPATPEIDPFAPRLVQIGPGFAPYEIHVDPAVFGLFWTLPGDRAIRYSVGIGRSGLYESGEFYVGAKKEWPSWTPTPEMIARNPRAYAQYADGMPGGPNNPLGARAIYLFTPGKGDTFLRIHGTNAPRTIGTAVSNGCVRLLNAYVEDLYRRVPLNSRVVLH